MYLEFFNFTKMPFGVDSDPEVIFPGAQYRYSLATLVHGVEQGMGMLVLTAEEGCGKSTLFRSLRATLEQEGKTVLVIDDPNADISDVVTSIASLLDRAREGMGLNDLIDRIRGRLTELSQEGRKLVVLVDNAEHLPDDVLVGLGALSGIGTPLHKLLQVVLIGGEQLKARLNFEPLRDMRSRIRLHLELERLSEAEAFAYIKYRLTESGGDAGLFTNACISVLVEASHGNPGAIERLCDQTLLAAYRRGVDVIDADVAREVILTAQPKRNPDVVAVSETHSAVLQDSEEKSEVAADMAMASLSEERFSKSDLPQSHVNIEQQDYMRRRGAGGRFGVTVAIVMGGVFLGILGYLVADFSDSGLAGGVVPQKEKKAEVLPQLSVAPVNSAPSQGGQVETESVPVIYRLLSGDDADAVNNRRESVHDRLNVGQEESDSTIPVLAATEGVKPQVRPLELETVSVETLETVPEVAVEFAQSDGLVPFPFRGQQEGEWRKMPDKLTLSQLARRQFGSWNDSVEDILRQSNPHLKSFDAITAGTKIWIPVISPQRLVVNHQSDGYYFYFRSTTGPITARRNKAYLQKNGVGAFVQSIESPHGVVHRIYGGPFDTSEEAENAMKKVKFTFAPSVLN